jgi:predicted PurR-regulated permease PerM
LSGIAELTQIRPAIPPAALLDLHELARPTRNSFEGGRLVAQKLAVDSRTDQTFLRRSVWVIGLAMGAVLFLLLLRTVAVVLLMLFTSVLIAIVLHGVAKRLAKRLRIPHGLALALFCTALVGATVAILTLAGVGIVGQVQTLETTLSESVQSLKTALQENQLLKGLVGQRLPFQVPPASALIRPVSSVVEGVTSALLTLFLSLFLAANPRLYLEGALRLLPPSRRARARQIAQQCAHALGWWTAGQLISMLTIGVLTAVGLWALGVPLAFTLGAIALALTFVPYVGTLISAVPALLLAFAQSPRLALWVIVLFIGVHAVEGYLLTPFIQRRAVQLPGAVLLAAQAVMALLGGVVGIALATPLSVLVMVLVQAVYVQGVLGERVEILAEKS